MLKLRCDVPVLRGLVGCGLAGCLGLFGLSGLNSHAQIASSTIPARNQIAPASVSGTPARGAVAPAQIQGRVRYQGDILIKSGAAPQSVGVLNTQSLWPKVNGVATVYYVIDANSDPNATSKINTAISTSNADFPGLLQWVQWTSGVGQAYVDINLSADDFSGECEAAEGYEGIAAQPMTGSTNCAIGTILHEMGHVIGLWHEQSRSDSASYITFNYGNVIKGSIGNFENSVYNEQNLTPYDYASVMEYPSYSFTRNGGPVIETIPAGMPLSGVDGVPVPANPDYSAGDKEGISRLYGAPPTQVTITSNPVGLQVEVDGATITTPQTYAWALNSTHTVAVASGVQTLTGDIANSTTSATFYYTYGRWNDSTAQSHTITVAPGNGQAPFPVTSPQVTTYAANFIQLVPYTAVVYPANSATVAISPQPQTYSGATGEFFVARQLATLTATPAEGYNFYEFNNGPFWLPGGLGANPKTFYVPDTGNPVNTTSEQSTQPVYTVDVSPDSFSSNLYVYVDGGFSYTPKNFASDYDSSWTVGSSHTLNLDSPEYPYSSNSRYAFSSWSDSGAQSHSIASLPATASSYIATLTPQFLAGTNFNYPPCGGSGTLSPASPTNDGFYPAGQTLQYTATPDATWTFAGWTYDITGTTNPASLVANDETLVFANFNTVNSPLTVTSLSPASATAGGAAFTLTLTGTGFSPTSLVSINGSYPPVTYVSSTELQIPVAANNLQYAEPLQVVVENYPTGWNGCAVLGFQNFNVYAAPPPPAPVVSLSPTSFTFANTHVGSTAAYEMFTLSNTGNASLSVSSITSTGTNASSFTIPSNHQTCSTVAAGSSCTFDVAFTPSAAGALSASILIADNASGSPQSVAVSGTGVAPSAPAFSVSPTSFTFANTHVGSTAAYEMFTVSNTGNATLTISSITSTGTNASSFTIPSGHQLCSSVAAGSTCTFDVAFTPTAAGALTASIHIADNATGSPQTVTVSGTGVAPAAPAVSLSPTSFTFANTHVGSTAAYEMFTLTNTGNATLTVSSVTSTGTNASSFTIPGNHQTCGSVTAGSSCTFDVAFTPTAVGALTASILIADNATGSPQSVNVSGTGVGASAPAVSISPTSFTFANTKVGSTAAYEMFTVSNTGNATLTVSSVTSTGTNASSFTIPSNHQTCGSVAAGSSCTFDVAFTPAAAGALTAAIQIADNASGSPQSVTVSGTGVAPSAPAVSLSPTSLTFPTTTVASTAGYQMVTLTNTGNATLTISSITSTGTNASSFTIPSNHQLCSSVAAGSSCTFDVAFTPTATGALSASIQITDNAAGSPQFVAVSGTGR